MLNFPVDRNFILRMYVLESRGFQPAVSGTNKFLGVTRQATFLFFLHIYS